MHFSPLALSASLIASSLLAAAPAPPEGKPAESVPLIVAAGAPLRLYLVKRLPKRLDQPVHAKLLEPLFSFDREVVPAGTEVSGRVARLDSVSKMRRFTAVLGGDFTPLHEARVEFTTLRISGGKELAVDTVESIGLNSIYSPAPPRKKPAKPKKAGSESSQTGVLGTGKQEAQARINAAINGRTKGIADIVRGPDKLERFEDLLLQKLPYHPQWVRKGTRFDAELRAPLDFGIAKVDPAALKFLGTQPPPDSFVHARLITPVSSATSAQGSPVEAVVTQPLFSVQRQLILPEGTRLTGAVTLARSARWLHRGGRLRFNFQKFDLPPALASLELVPRELPPMRTQASLAAAESTAKTQIKVDEEGGVEATEPKTRLVAPLISYLIAMKSLDNDADRHGGNETNAGGRTLGGASGFGLLGAAAAQSSRTLGSVLGVYGMAWSFYSTFFARGGEVEFIRNDAMDIRFGSRPPADLPKVKSEFKSGGGGSY